MRLRWLAAVVSCAAFGVSGVACMQRARPASDEATQARPAAVTGRELERSQPAVGEGTSGAAAPPPAAAPTAGLEAMAAARKLVRTGQASVEVPSCAEAVPALTRLAESLGGYVSESRSQRDGRGRERASVTLRVPAGRFDETLAGAAGLGTLLSKNVNAQDVTKAYTDLETRLRVKRETADRLREILRTRTAGLADVLAAERELARVTEEIEQAEGERRFYDQQLALSTLSVELVEPGSIVKSSALDPLREALSDAARVLSASLAAMVYAIAFLSPWVLALALLWRIARAIRERRTNKKTPKTP